MVHVPLETDAWQIIELFEPLHASRVQLVEQSIYIPPELFERSREDWADHLDSVEAAYRQKGIPVVRTQYDDTEFEALFRQSDDAPVAWPDFITSYERHSFSEDGSLNIAYALVEYPVQVLINDGGEELREPYRLRNIQLPRTFGCATIPRTQDGQLIVFERGKRALNFPDSLAFVGGAPDPRTPLAEHQLEKICRKLMAPQAWCDPLSIVFNSIVYDRRDFDYGLYGWADIACTSEGIIANFNRQAAGTREPDVEGLLSIPAAEGPLHDYLLTNTAVASHILPTAQAAIAAYGAHHFGMEWAQGVAAAFASH